MAKLTKGNVNAIRAAFKAQWFDTRANKLLDTLRDNFDGYVRNCDEQVAARTLLNLIDGGMPYGAQRDIALRSISKSSSIDMYMGGIFTQDVRALFLSVNEGNTHIDRSIKEGEPPYVYIGIKFNRDAKGYVLLQRCFVKDFNNLCKRWYTVHDQFNLALNNIKTVEALKEHMPKAYKLYQVEVLKVGQPSVPVAVVDYTAADSLLN